MDLLDRIGPVLGIVAFAGLAILAFLIIQQAREVRRLRDWAGRAPERATEATDASLAAAEARWETAEEAAHEPGRLAALWERFKEAAAPRWEELDRRSPVDPRYLVTALAVAALAGGVLSGGFGVLGGDEGNGGRGGQRQRQAKPDVAVLNATQVSGIQGVPGLAAKVLNQVVKPAGYASGPTANATAGIPETVVMYEPGQEDEARELAADIEPELGPTSTQLMTADARRLAGEAGLVVVIGQDDAQF